ncbi:MAG: hypothetical protein CMJ76_12835 [Planctomycetaceae bacterium]|nr:hypothetical protein [Planctomycetaceae bacterium]|tara:strand:+ start:2244 stop:2480 length:237 start_codon:yes stop_codon:yes gene_type:complete
MGVLKTTVIKQRKSDNLGVAVLSDTASIISGADLLRSPLLDAGIGPSAPSSRHVPKAFGMHGCVETVFWNSDIGLIGD